MHILSVPVTQLEKIVTADVGHKVAVGTIGGDYFAAQSMLIQPGSDQIEPDQFACRHFRPDPRPVFAVGQVRADRRKNVAPMERGRQGGANHPVAVRDLMHGCNSIPVLDQRHQSIVGQHKILAALRLHYHRLARAANSRIDHHHEHRAFRKVGSRTVKEAGAVEYREWRDLVSQVHNAQFGRNGIHHALAQGHGIIYYAEVGHEHNCRGRFRCRLRTSGNRAAEGEYRGHSDADYFPPV